MEEEAVAEGFTLLEPASLEPIPAVASPEEPVPPELVPEGLVPPEPIPEEPVFEKLAPFPVSSFFPRLELAGGYSPRAIYTARSYNSRLST